MSWESWEKTAVNGPVRLGCWMMAVLFTFIAIGGVVGWTSRWFSEAGQVVQEELGARAVKTKYEWFKEAAATLDKKNADIGVYQGRLDDLVAGWRGKPRSSWPRDERETYNQCFTELAGVKASFNQLASEYNAKMAEIHWAFCNAGELPKGAVALPREFRSYLDK